MQLIFDSRYDGLAQARLALVMLKAYIDGHPEQSAAMAHPQDAVPAEPAPSLPPFGQQQAPAPAAGPSAPTVPPPPVPSAPPVSSPPAVASSPEDTEQDAASADANRTHDARGMPYDERIHAANRSVITNGNWRKKKGLNDEGFIKRIEAELMAGPNARPPQASGVAQAAAAAAAAVAEPVPPPPVEVILPPPLPPAATAMPPAPPNVEDPNTYDGFVKYIGRRMGGAIGTKLPFDQIQAAMKVYGLSGLPDLQANPGFCGALYADLQKL